MPNEKQAVALTSMLASAGMTIGKLTVGVATGCLGVLSEGVHSLLDFVATALTYAAVRVSDTPPDDDHPYGHGTVENVAALAETALLFLTSAWILFEAAQRLLSCSGQACRRQEGEGRAGEEVGGADTSALGGRRRVPLIGQGSRGMST